MPTNNLVWGRFPRLLRAARGPLLQAGYVGWVFCIHCGAWRAADDDAPAADWVP
ncbi:hypothetical protein ACJ2CR_19060 [Myxococcus faecalis]|uniref:hypothetical protein n=1 Tax=Myxococcus faecalis TaxID=3115646 RepID=UPI0038CF5FE7